MLFDKQKLVKLHPAYLVIVTASICRWRLANVCFRSSMYVSFKHDLCGDLSAAPRCHEAMERLCDSVMTRTDLQRE